MPDFEVPKDKSGVDVGKEGSDEQKKPERQLTDEDLAEDTRQQLEKLRAELDIVQKIMREPTPQDDPEKRKEMQERKEELNPDYWRLKHDIEDLESILEVLNTRIENKKATAGV